MACSEWRDCMTGDIREHSAAYDGECQSCTFYNHKSSRCGYWIAYVNNEDESAQALHKLNKEMRILPPGCSIQELTGGIYALFYPEDAMVTTEKMHYITASMDDDAGPPTNNMIQREE